MNQISLDTGIRFSYPMTSTMVQSLTETLIKRGLKAGTIISYMVAIRQAHMLKGLEASAFSDSMVKAALKRIKNPQAVKETPRAVMTLDLLIKARDKLKSLRMSAERKRGI